jgi:hypothetical protein
VELACIIKVFFGVKSRPVRGRDGGTSRDIISVDFCTWADTLETETYWNRGIYLQTFFNDSKKIMKVLNCVTIDRCEV